MLTYKAELTFNRWMGVTKMRRGIGYVGKEVKESAKMWMKRREGVAHRLPITTLRHFEALTQQANIGYADGKIRPGEEGRLDLYRLLTAPDRDCDEQEALIATGLKEDQVTDPEYQLESEVDRLRLIDFELFDAEDQKLQDFLAEVEIDLVAA